MNNRSDTEVKLTPKQQMVIELLQNGESLTTSAADMYSSAYAGVTCGKETIQISLRVFWNLVNKGLIDQTGKHHEFVLTPKGKNLKFKK